MFSDAQCKAVTWTWCQISFLGIGWTFIAQKQDFELLFLGLGQSKNIYGRRYVPIGWEGSYCHIKVRMVSGLPKW
jgi:hypothetical protein